MLLVLISAWMATACSKDDPLSEPMGSDLPMQAAYVMDSSYLESSKMKVYNIAYPSRDPYGNPIMLSAAITMGEQVVPGSKARGMLLYNHFTIYRTDQCPTRGNLDVEAGLVSNGMITISPDYYGFGVTQHHHQAYCLSAVNARASLDAVVAARSLLAGMGYVWADTLINGGYSQGGQTTMAVVRMATQEYPDVHITQTIAGAGAYDIPATYASFLDTAVAGQPSNVVSVLLAYNEFMQLGFGREELFTEPVLSHIDDWFFSKRYTRAEIDSKIGSLSIDRYCTAEVIDTTTETARRLLAAFDSDNLCKGWTPRTDEHILLFHSNQDITVPEVCTQHLYDFLTESGVQDVDLQVYDIEGTDEKPAHERAAIFFLMAASRKINEILGLTP